jgi:DNA polymerase (family X)
LHSPKARQVADEVSIYLSTFGVKHEICGGLRRQATKIRGIKIVVDDFPKACEAINIPIPKITTSKTGRKVLIAITKLDGVGIQLHHAFHEEWGAMMINLTGNNFFIIQMRSRAKKEGMLLNQYGLWFNENIIAGVSEEQIFEVLDMSFIPPQARELKPRETIDEVLIREGLCLR